MRVRELEGEILQILVKCINLESIFIKLAVLNHNRIVYIFKIDRTCQDILLVASFKQVIRRRNGSVF